MNNYQEIKATVQIGKNGLTKFAIEELIKQLKKRKIVKVRVLRNALGQKSEIFEKLSNIKHSEIIKKIGNTFILRRQ